MDSDEEGITEATTEKLRFYKYVENPAFQPGKIGKSSAFSFMQYRSAYIQ
jgi:hypothetical protein